MFLLNVVCCQLEVSAMGLSLVRRSPTECGMSECDPRTSQRKPRSTRGCRAVRKGKTFGLVTNLCLRKETTAVRIRLLNVMVLLE
jgi:hypothetical protein